MSGHPLFACPHEAPVLASQREYARRTIAGWDNVCTLWESARLVISRVGIEVGIWIPHQSLSRVNLRGSNPSVSAKNSSIQVPRRPNNTPESPYATYLGPRRKILQWWAEHLDELRQGASVQGGMTRPWAGATDPALPARWLSPPGTSPGL